MYNDPGCYGVVEFDENRKAIGLEEKPDNPKSNYAVTVSISKDNTVVVKSKKVLKPFSRIEITDFKYQVVFRRRNIKKQNYWVVVWLFLVRYRNT
jgi:dTDP-glucose pyrophosphorylase